jgi:hypothetical protein
MPFKNQVGELALSKVLEEIKRELKIHPSSFGLTVRMTGISTSTQRGTQNIGITTYRELYHRKNKSQFCLLGSGKAMFIRKILLVDTQGTVNIFQQTQENIRLMFRK